MSEVFDYIVTDDFGVTQHFVRIVNGENETCMLKSDYEKMIAEQDEASTL